MGSSEKEKRRRERASSSESRKAPGAAPLGRSIERERGAIRPEPPEDRLDTEMIC